MGAQVALTKLHYYRTLKQLNKALFELNNSIGRLPGYQSYVSTHTNLLTPRLEITQ